MSNWIPSGALAATLFFMGAGEVNAQQPSTSGVFLPTSTEYQVLWQRMERAQEKGNWDAVLEGLALYVQLVEQPEVNTVLSGGGETALGIRRILERFVDALPPDELRRYRTRLNDVLTRAWEQSRLRALPKEHRLLRHRLLRDYEDAETVPAALKDSIDEAFEAGSWLRARDECERLLQLEESASAKEGAFTLTEEDYVRALVLLSQTCQLLGDAGASTTNQEVLRRRLEAAGGDISEDLRALVIAHLDAGVPASVNSGAQRRTQESALKPLVPPSLFPSQPQESYRLGRVMWERRVSGSSLRPFVRERAKTAPAGAVPLPYYAAASDGVIVFHHADRLVAYDSNVRRTRWSIPLHPVNEDFATIRCPLLAPGACYYTQEPALHAIDLDTAAPLWKASFYYDNFRKALRFADEIPAPGEMPSDTQEETLEEDRGEEEEEHEEENHETTSAATTLSLSPPALYRDRVLISIQARIGQEVLLYLVCLDSAGNEVWITFLGSSQGINYLGLAARNSVPLVSESTIYQLSNTGVLAALDAEDGTILWINQYQSLTSRGTREAIRQENRWQPNPVLPVGPNLIIAPQDSPYLMAIQKETGALAWRIPRTHETVLVGATDKACFLVGEAVSAIGHSGAEQGRLLWRFRPGASGFRLQPLGRSLLTRNSLLIPCRTTLLSLSLTDGSLLAQTLWDFTAGGGGNLLLAEPKGSSDHSGKKSVLAVSNPSGILVYNHLEVERARIDSLPSDDTESLLQRAKFHLKNSEIESSLTALGLWFESDTPAPQPNSRLDHLHLDLAEMIHQILEAGEAEVHSEKLLRYRVHLEGSPRRKVEAAIALADSLEEKGRPGQALEALHQAIAFDNPATDYSPDGILSVMSANYLRERILHLRKQTPDPQQTFLTVDTAAREALESALQKTTTALLEVIRLYPFTPASAKAYLDLSLRFRDSQSYDQAIKSLEAYIADYPQGENVITAKLIVANLLYQSGRGQQAKACYLDLLKHHPKSSAEGVPGTHEGETVEEYVRPIIGDPGLREKSFAEYRTLRFPIQMKWRSPADLQALKRTFLLPEGVPPERIESCFLTQSEDTLELRDTETGMPVWKIYLEMIPGFEFEPYPFGRTFRYPRSRSGKRAFSGRYVRAASALADENRPPPLLVLYEARNILAVDALKGTVLWHVPVGPEKETRGSKPRRPQLRETLWGVAVTEAGVFALTSRSRLLHYSDRGELLWETELAYELAPHKRPIVFGGNVFVHSRPSGLRVHDTETGKEKTEEALGAAEGLEKLDHPPIELVGDHRESPGGRVLLTSSQEVKLLDLQTRTILWSFSQQGKHREILKVAYDPKFPRECIVFFNRANNWPAMASISLDDGEERWRYDKFPAAKARFSVVRDRNRFYTIRSRKGRSHLLAIQIRPGTEVGKPIAQALWPNEVNLVGQRRSGSLKGKLHVSGDSVIFTNQGKVFVYDKLQGIGRTSPTSIIDKFLVEKKECATAIVKDRLILLTDGGDCSFGPQGVSTASSIFSPEAKIPPAERSPFKGRHGENEIELLQRYQANPGALESTAHLALQYFRDGELGSAIRLLNQALVSENLLLENGTEKQFLLSYLLDGIKEEYMKRRVPKIRARKFRHPPAIDGELNDTWDVASRIHLGSPKNLGTIPGPGRLRDWEGKEDLSAVLYTGWDEKYFYFALDVTDDVLYPYDRDADNWKGDCLLIGLDPTGDGGYKQRGNDQLMTLALTVPKRNKRDKEEDKEGEEGEDEEGEEDEDEEEKQPKGLFSVRKKNDNSGALYEVGLPWSSFSSSYADGYAPPSGFAFGLSLLLTDDDTGQGATKTLSINPCHLLPRNQKNSPVWRFIIPYFFPRVTLE